MSNKIKASLSMPVKDINFLETPHYIRGTNFYFIGTAKPGAGCFWCDANGEGADLDVSEGCNIYVRQKDVQRAFTHRVTVEDAVSVMRRHPPGEDEFVTFGVTLQKSLPDLFMMIGR